MSTQDHDHPAGHYQTAGFAIVGMGVLSAVVFAMAVLSNAELGFIDERGILGIAGTFLVVGLFMTNAAPERS